MGLTALNLQKFVGTWKLVSFEMRGEEGDVTYPFGKDALGYIMYSSDGYMSVAFYPRNRRKSAAVDLARATLEEKAAAAESYVTYFGRYEVKQDKVIHHVEASLIPNWVGVDQERFFRFDANRLTLTTTPVLFNGKNQIGYLIWDKT